MLRDRSELVTTLAKGPPASCRTTPVASVKLRTTDGLVIERELQAGRDTAEWAYDREDVRVASRTTAPRAVRVGRGGFEGHRYLARLKFDRAEIADIELAYVANEADITFSRAALYDEATQQTRPLDAVSPPVERWRKLQSFGTVVLYENLKALPRAWFVKRVAVVPRAQVLQAIKTSALQDGTAFDPAETALLEREDLGNRRS